MIDDENIGRFFAEADELDVDNDELDEPEADTQKQLILPSQRQLDDVDKGLLNELRDFHGRWTRGGDSSSRKDKFVSHHDKPRHGYGDIKPTPKMIADLKTGSATKYMNDKGEFTASRQRLHDRIVDDALHNTEPVHNPKFVMMGGGSASGKSTMISSGKIDTENHVVIDPDAIKLKLPEARKMKKNGNDAWAAFSHEESSYLSSRIQAAALETKRNALLDGTGDSSLEKAKGKIEAARAAGHTVEAHYTTVNVDEALKRADKRAKKTGRVIPESDIRQIYAGISTIFPDIANEFDSVRMYDNNGTELKLIASSPSKGKFKVLDSSAYADFLKNKDALNG